MRVMIVDDSRAMRMVVRRSLRLAGIPTTRVVEAGSVAEALRLLRRTPVDLVLCDWNMPGANGLRLLEALQQEPCWASVSSVLVSAEQDPRLVDDARRRGVGSFLAKPFTPAELRHALQLAKVA